MKIRKGRWGCASGIAICLCVTLCACGFVRSLPDYREEGFWATIRWESQGVTVCADIETESSEGERAHLRRVTLSAPPALAGAILEESEAGISMTLDGVRIVSAGAEEIWQTCALLVSDGVMRDVCDTEWQGLAVRYSEIGEGEDLCSLFRDRKTGAPLRLEQGERVLVVERFLHT